ncbi:hypothetical protein R1flu_026826 [Riccia fluitans]|uniref:NAD-dependent epimerase/dehydratase domain-containing protein n=1 Tax=Riccia fluitans TaxID=41844 RepID=A0ABD1XHS8_9MARC
MCQAHRQQYGFDAISAMPTNLFGPNDNFDPEKSHVLPGMISEAIRICVNNDLREKNDIEIVVWGTGTPSREFLHCDALADAALFFMQNYSDPSHIKVGSGKEITMKQLAELVKEMVGFEGEIQYDPSKPDGTMKKLLDSSKLVAMGWDPKIKFKEDLVDAYQRYLDNFEVEDFLTCSD